jgi:ABC-2 type transport system permease protein
MWTLFKKEISGFFSSLTGYVVIAVFLLGNSLFIWLPSTRWNILENGYASLDPLFSLAPWIFLFLVPAITMRMISEEKRTGTLDLLLTRPVNGMQIVFAKYLASWVLVFLSLLPTLVWFWSVSRMASPAGNVDMGGTWGSYLGLLFLGGIYAAIGIFTSSLTQNQIVSFILAVAVSFFFFQGLEFLAGSAGSGRAAYLISRAGIAYHYASMSRGVLDSRDLLYFLVVMGMFTLGAGAILHRRHWNRGDVQVLAIVLAVVVLLSVLSGLKYFRVDLTSEKRYTLSRSSRELLRGLDGVLTARIYLKGEMPAEFIRFKHSIEDLMDDCRAYAGEHLQYEFVNLYDEEDEKLRNRMIGELYNRGLKVTSIQVNDGEGGTASRIIFPGALVSYGSYTMPVNFLKNNPALPPEVNLNNSIQTLEYELMRALHSLTLKEVPAVAFTEGHGELDSLQTHSLMDQLKNFFRVDRGYINGNLETLLDYRALIIACPVRPFSEADKFAIDQYIMNGGNVLFFLDPVNPFADSLTGGTTVALARQVGLEDMLFRYGIRVNYDLVADIQCSPVPVNVSSTGEQARFEMMPWVYFPLLSGKADHPVTRGLNYVRGEFVSSLDTVGSGGQARRTVLLASSPGSRRRKVPLYISMEEVTRPPDPALYHAGPLPVAVLAEGKFSSFYRNYPVPDGVSLGGKAVLDESKPASVLVVADGQLPENEVRFEQGAYRAQPLGYDRYTRQTYGNLEFIMNAVSQMTDDRGLMELRSREFKLRLLNREITGRKERVRAWKGVNTGVPLFLLLLTALLVRWIRKKRYSP